MPPSENLQHSREPTSDSYQGRDIVVISIQPWYYELGSNCKNIALQFARQNRVLYINIPITRKTFYSKNNNDGVRKHIKIIKEKKYPLEQIQENLWQYFPTTLIESINWVPSTFIFRHLNFVNNERFADDIKRATGLLNFTNIVLFNDNDIYNGFHLKELLNPKTYVYYMRDFLQGYKFWKKFSEILEPILIKKADVVVTNSKYYEEYCLSHNTRSYYVGQGCNLDIFSNSISVFPADLYNIARPIVGYVGALDSARLSLDAIRSIATARPDWNVVLVGPEDQKFATSDLHSLENIHFLGRRDMNQLPDFVQAFDVCINPQSTNVITNGNYPLKIDEYLAMGKPVVATKTHAMQLFSEYTYLAQSPGDYPILIEKALKDARTIDKTRLVEFARSHTWEHTTKQIYRALMEHEQ